MTQPDPTTPPPAAPASGTPAAPASGAPAGGSTGTTPPASTSDKAPTWEGEFDAARAATLVANLRKELDAEKAKRKAREDAELTELQKAQKRAQELEAELTTARTERLISAAVAKHKLPDDLAAFVTGTTPEEIEAKAAALAKFATPAPSADTLSGRPRPRLVPGSAPSATGDAFDPHAVARAARRF